MEELQQFSFVKSDETYKSLSSRENRDSLLQWNLDTCLQIQKFRFSGGGGFSSNSVADYDRLMKDFVRDDAVRANLKMSGSPAVPVTMDANALGLSVMSMEFFDRLNDTGILYVYQ
jgi:hypothetical protein